jgi:hypothetical protein
MSVLKSIQTGASVAAFVPYPARQKLYPSSAAWKAGHLNPLPIYISKLSKKKGYRKNPGPEGPAFYSEIKVE